MTSDLKSPSKIFYSFLHKRNEAEERITFYPSSEFDWARNIEANSAVISKEIIDYLKVTNELQPYFAKELVNAPDKWKALGFYFWSLRRSKKACMACPNTIALLSGIPGVVTAAISILEPGSEIKPHHGDTNAIYRCHLGLIVPASLPECGFRVGSEERSWEAGKLLIFNDVAKHSGWNRTDQQRIILLFDVIKPEYKEQKAWICSKVLGFIFFQMFNEKLKMFKGRPGWLIRSLYQINSMIIWVYLHSLKRKSSWL